MKFVENIEKDRYDNFVKQHEKSHFLQSYAWGEFSKSARNLIPHYIGLEDDKKRLVATALLLEKKLFLGYSYFYSPRGFVIDFKDKKLLKLFTDEVRKYAKKNKAIFIKIDPDIIIKRYDDKDELTKEEDYKETFKNLIDLKFKHLGFTKNFESTQPRYTFRINLKKSEEELFNSFSKTTKQRINKAEKLLTEVRVGNLKDVETFSNLMIKTEKRKDFISHNYDYYKKLYEIYNIDNDFKLFVSNLNIKKVINEYEEELSDVKKEITILKEKNSTSKKLNELIMREDKLYEYITEYKEAIKKHGEEVVLNIHAAIIYGDKSWGIYAANDDILMNSYSNYKTYYEQIRYCQNQNISFFDQFGTIGDLSKNNPLLGIHIFKKGFGGEYIEFIGEFDLVINKTMYFTFNKLIPIYRKIVKRKIKKQIKKTE